MTRRDLRQREPIQAAESVQTIEPALETRRQRRERERAAETETIVVEIETGMPVKRVTEPAAPMIPEARGTGAEAANLASTPARSATTATTAPAETSPVPPQSAKKVRAATPIHSHGHTRHHAPRRHAPVTSRPAASRPAKADWKRKWVSSFVMVITAGLVAAWAVPAYANAELGALAPTTSTHATTKAGAQHLTVSGADPAAIVRDGYTSETAAQNAVAMDSTTGTTVSPTVQALATELMADVAAGKLVGSTPNHIPEIQNLANGVAVPGCGVDFRVLQVIKVAVQNFGRVGVSDINRRCTGQIEGAGTASPHYSDGGGHAVDFYLLNGHALTGGDADSVKLIEILDPMVPAKTNLGQVGCRASMTLKNFVPFSDSCSHLHIDFGTAQGAGLND